MIYFAHMQTQLPTSTGRKLSTRIQVMILLVIVLLGLGVILLTRNNKPSAPGTYESAKTQIDSVASELSNITALQDAKVTSYALSGKNTWGADDPNKTTYSVTISGNADSAADLFSAIDEVAAKYNLQSSSGSEASRLYKSDMFTLFASHNPDIAGANTSIDLRSGEYNR